MTHSSAMPTSIDSLKNIIYEDINDEYGRGKYGDFDIIIMKKNTYINATKLCKEGGKRFSNWSRLDHSKEFMDTLNGLLRSEQAIAIKINDTSENELRGTYVHQDLIPHIASWVSPMFAIAVSRIVNDYMARKFNQVVKERDDLQKRLDLIISQNERIIKDNDDTKQQMKQMEEKNQERHDELKGIIKSAIDLLKEEPQRGNQILLIYRLKSEAKEILHIHAGKRSSFKIPKAEDCSYLFIGDAISNAKRILRFLKDKDIVPKNGALSTYKITSGTLRKKIYGIVNGINDEYKKVSVME